MTEFDYIRTPKKSIEKKDKGSMMMSDSSNGANRVDNSSAKRVYVLSALRNNKDEEASIDDDYFEGGQRLATTMMNV